MGQVPLFFVWRMENNTIMLKIVYNITVLYLLILLLLILL